MKKINHASPSNGTPSKLFAFDTYLEGRNLTRTTGYRYRRAGLLKTINIFGRLYITREEIEKFEDRAINGDFHKAAKTPARSKVGHAPAAAGSPGFLHSPYLQLEGHRHE